jgi:hypothetical protein
MRLGDSKLPSIYLLVVDLETLQDMRRSDIIHIGREEVEKYRFGHPRHREEG